MIQSGDLHKHFAVRHVATGRTLRLTGARDLRYAVTGSGVWDYRMCPTGDYFLVESLVHTHPWHWPVRLEDVEPLPDGSGLCHPDHLVGNALQLELTYEGSWRQAANQAQTS